MLQDAVTDVLDRGISLRAVAADLRARGMRTVTGKPFSAVSLRDAMLAAHVAGIAICNGARYDASEWLEPIIEPDRWERLADLHVIPLRQMSGPHAVACLAKLAELSHPAWSLPGWCATVPAATPGGCGPAAASATVSFDDPAKGAA